ncbi:polysaccharide pyruvyl transferase family protein [Evansella clarkii]|uniref:polysaccharide pyruvyl transferase family protein n=1 Tax=Evansella clarkii TaxID=79879 RepID=UPI00099750DC|nr:polysaccharide pyruvyl transferase family protein [Evansella clarkii]
MGKKLKIGFVGPYSTANFGDWGMLLNNMYDLECEDFVIFTYSSKFPQISLDDYCSEFNTEYVEVKLKEERDNNQEQQEKYFSTPYDVLMRVENLNELKKAIKKIDVLVISGGGWINHFWTERLEKLYKIMAPILVARQQEKKVVFTANGIGPFDETKEFYRYFFGYIKGAKIAIRDNYCSLSHLMEAGIESKDVDYLPDDMYLVNPTIVNKELHREIQQKNYIVMETFYPMELLRDNEQELINFSKKIYEKYGYSIVLLPYDLVEYGSDQAKYLHKIMEQTEIYNIDEIGYLPIQDAISIIKNAKLMITARYHGLVLSLSVETPVIFRLYDKRGDFRYTYNKGMGMLRTAFEGIEFCETDFLQKDLINILNIIESNVQNVINKQKKLYSSKRYVENKANLKAIRTKYLKEVLGD